MNLLCEMQKYEFLCEIPFNDSTTKERYLHVEIVEISLDLKPHSNHFIITMTYKVD